MSRSRSITTLAGAVALALTALTVAGCGRSGTSRLTAPRRTKDGRTATVGVATGGLGRILVNSQGRTLYLFQKDSGTTSALHRRLRQLLAAAAGELQADRG